MRSTTYERKSWGIGYIMVLPYFLFFVLFSLVPIFFGLRISFYDWALLGTKKFVAFKNYHNLLIDKEFWIYTWHTFMFVIISAPLLVLTGLALALLINQIRKWQSFFRASVFLPMMLSVSVISTIWVIFLQPYSGLLSQLLKLVGYQKEIFWISQPILAWVSIIIATVWWTVGLVFILYLAGLQDIPQTFYEAGQIEGASRWQSFRFITLPSLSRVTLLVIVLQTIACFKIFGQSKLITSGGPAGGTKTIVFMIYEKGFKTFDLGYASAVSILLMMIIMIISALQFKYMPNEN
ncbi:carbohydrate ABC transporter permease [Paenibacillus rigui]|uniref:Sugar ABC transporter permease n=1 Tax=Paenibacillus rigui TaxID=554312 RepID=A0A229URH7_9BACL|nr:sugar ABC transporter permease [Paenibacillus rigui]OXM86000.1 sugar ABC transporter permease [Paenibacillus rigui]